ncbi:MAG: hypothetical protein H7Z71_11330 [Moraxellaceae bacterium]|nr:hypothetical protein [Pseudobdellovibrionaceae bacterium]
MITVSQGASGLQKMPNTQTATLLNDHLIIFIRSWNGPEIAQKIIDEVNHYMSSVEADLEVTSPFGFSENLSALTNKVKIAMLLANDNIYNTENKEIYQHGAEVAIVFQKDSEISWACVGRFSLEAQKENRKIKLFDSGSRFDDAILLPVNLIGIMKDPEILAGSISTKKLQQLEIKSVFGQYESVWECQISDF